MPSPSSPLCHHVCIFLGAFVVAAPGLLGGSGHAATKPNILFVAIDDLNDYISPLAHHPGIKTPNFDRLAERSVNFTNAHCAAPACHPSRVAVMTGVHPARSGLYTNLFGAQGPRWREESPVLKDALVLSQHFRNHGYYAVGAGKIFHTLQWGNDDMNDPAAWDEYFRAGLPPLPPWPRPPLIDDEEAGLTRGRPLGGKVTQQWVGGAPLDVPDSETSDYQLVDWAAGELRKPRRQPVFIAVGLFRPHIPWEVPRKYFDLYPLDQLKLPEHRVDDLDDAFVHGRRAWHKWILENGLWPKFLQAYLASISYADAQLGRLLDALDASPQKDNTVLVVWSDHGYHMGEKENWEKFALWDQTTRIPLFIAAPGVSRNGARTGRPASLVDIYPTLCELAGLPVPKQCDGTSLVPQLKDPQAPRSRPAITSHVFDSVYVLGPDGQMRKERTEDARTKGIAASHAVRDDRYRYIRYHTGFEELYDHETDPKEYTNLAADPKFAAIKRRLAQLLPANPAWPVAIPEDSQYKSKAVRTSPSTPAK